MKKANVIGNSVLVVAICTAIALPLVAWHNADAGARAKSETLSQQKEAIDELSAVNAKRKKELARKNAGGLTDEQIKELLRLRAEVGTLRKATNELERLRAENQSLQTEAAR